MTYLATITLSGRRMVEEARSLAAHKAYTASQELNKDAESFFDSVSGFNADGTLGGSQGDDPLSRFYAPAAGDEYEDSKDYPAAEARNSGDDEETNEVKLLKALLTKEQARLETLPEGLDKECTERIIKILLSSIANEEQLGSFVDILKGVAQRHHGADDTEDLLNIRLFGNGREALDILGSSMNHALKVLDLESDYLSAKYLEPIGLGKPEAQAVIEMIFARAGQKIVKIVGEQNAAAAGEVIGQAIKEIDDITDEHLNPGEKELLKYAATYFVASGVAKGASKAGAFAGKHLSDKMSYIKDHLPTLKNKFPHLNEAFFDKLGIDHQFSSVEKLQQLVPLNKWFNKAGHFEKNLVKIEGAVLHGKKLTDLPEKIVKDFGPLLKFEKDGTLSGIVGMQNHHVLHKANPAIKKLFKRAGMDIDAPANRVFLPDQVGKSIYPSERSLHHGMHTKKSISKLATEAEKFCESGGTPERARNLIRTFVAEERKALLKGKPLNNALPLHEKVQQ